MPEAVSEKKIFFAHSFFKKSLSVVTLENWKRHQITASLLLPGPAARLPAMIIEVIAGAGPSGSTLRYKIYGFVSKRDPEREKSPWK